MRRYWGFLAALVVVLALLAAACGGGGDSTSERAQVEATVQKIVKAFNDEDPEPFWSTVAPAVRVVVNGTSFDQTKTRELWIKDLLDLKDLFVRDDIRAKFTIKDMSISFSPGGGYAYVFLAVELAYYRRSTGVLQTKGVLTCTMELRKYEVGWRAYQLTVHNGVQMMLAR